MSVAGQAERWENLPRWGPDLGLAIRREQSRARQQAGRSGIIIGMKPLRF
jgi:hypothetical protein